MTQATLAELADEIAATIENALAAAGEEIQVTGRLNRTPDSFAIDVYPADPFVTQEEAAFGWIVGAHHWVVRARIAGDRDAEQDLLLQLMDDTDDLSVANALMDDQTLNGLATSVEVDGPSGYTQYVGDGGDSAMLGVEWRVTILRAYS